MSDINLTNLIINHLTREELHSMDFTDHGDELFVQSDHAGVSVGGVGIDALDTTNIANCITHIPRDIKLELSNGTLTLKAGSKVYVPNGAGVFDTIITENDIARTGFAYSGQFFLGLKIGGTGFEIQRVSDCASGTNPTGHTGLYYKTNDNTIKFYSNGTPTADVYSLPIGIISSDGTNIVSLDQTFNGFGYIGSTLFALPGVKGLIPNGRNTDGTAKNQQAVIDTIKTWFNDNYSFNNFQIGISANDGISVGLYSYDIQTNTTTESKCIVGSVTGTSGRIDRIKIKKVFTAIDYNDSEYIAHQAMPSSAYIDMTLGASGSSYTAPADGYINIARTSTAAGQYIQGYTGINSGVFSTASGQSLRLSMPVRKGFSFQINYNAPTAGYFRFVPAVGSY